MDKVKSKETLENLIRGDEVREVLVQNIVYQNIKTNPRTGLNFLLQSGYLKASDPVLKNGQLDYLLQLPNMEILSLITDMVMYWFSESSSVSEEMEDLVKYINEADWPLFEDRLKRLCYPVLMNLLKNWIFPLGTEGRPSNFLSTLKNLIYRLLRWVWGFVNVMLKLSLRPCGCSWL